MLSHKETSICDSRGESIPLRPDPEGVWKQRGSFRLELGRRYRRYKKQPRIAVVLAMRELQNLEMRPASRVGVVWVCVMLTAYALAFTTLIYGTFLMSIFGAWNWFAIAITFVGIWLITIGEQWLRWTRNDGKYDEICRVLETHPAYCAGCWYPLGDQTEPDGCVICPECGAAWMVVRDQSALCD